MVERFVEHSSTYSFIFVYTNKAPNIALEQRHVALKSQYSYLRIALITYLNKSAFVKLIHINYDI